MNWIMRKECFWGVGKKLFDSNYLSMKYTDS